MNANVEPADKLGRWLAIAGGLVVAGAVIGAIAVMGTPGAQRLQRIDERRIEDLGTLVDAVRAYAKEHGGMPADLATLAREPGANLPVADPETQAPYDYARVDAERFRVCAVFDTDTSKTRTWGPYGRWTDMNWRHAAGRQCFTRTKRDRNIGGT